MTMKIEQALGSRGFLIWSPYIQGYVYRVYDSEDKKEFTDYEINVFDLEVEIKDRFCELVVDDEGVNRLDYKNE